jgi:hypothetical protein
VNIDDVIIDTGAFHTIITTDFLDELGAKFSNDDKLIEAFGYSVASNYAVRKKINSISCGYIGLKNFKIDFGEIDQNERVNGLLGLDFLKEAKIILGLEELVMYTQ